FMNDSPPQAAEIIQSLAGWIADPAQTELLRSAKRAAHTLKGSANILGIQGVAKLAHRLEDVLELCEVDTSAPSRTRTAALMAAADCLEQMVAAVCGEDSAPDNALAIAAELEQELNGAATQSRELTERDRAIQKRLFELENSVDIRGVVARHKLHAVQNAHFDSLEMDQYNEVQSITRALIEETTDARDLG